MKIKYGLLICFYFLFIADLFCTDSFSKYWWKIEMDIFVKGKYKYGIKNHGFGGDYSFRMILLGTIERDNSHYIFFPEKQDILKLMWKETIYSRERRKKELDLSKKVKPGFKLNYILRSKGKIFFDFEISSIFAPFKGSNYPKKILLPRSAVNKSINKKDKYNNDVRKGSNQIVLFDDRIYQKKEVIKLFEWRWTRNKLLLRNSHTVELKLKVSKKEK